MKFKTRGEKKVISNIRAKLNDISDDARQEFLDGCNDIMAESMDECPVKTGFMRRSATVQDNTDTSGKFSVKLGYDAEYAIYVHENLTAQHPVGKAKFLEDPVNRNRDELLDKLRRNIKK